MRDPAADASAPAIVERIETHTRALADALDVVGLLNVQYAVKDGEVFVIEANPRASRTVPFVSKATGVPLAKVAARVMVGATLDELRAEGLLRPPAEGGHVAVKEAVLPFNRFPDVDTVLGPEMRSTGEVMGIDRSFGLAFAKSQAGAGNRCPRQGTVFLSLADRDKAAGLVAARRFAELGLRDRGDRRHRRRARGRRARRSTRVVAQGPGEPDGSGRVDAVDCISSGKVDLVVNTPRGRGPRADGMHIRRAAIAHGVACVTTVAAALAAAAGIGEWSPREARGAVAAGVPPRRPAAARACEPAPHRPRRPARRRCRSTSRRPRAGRAAEPGRRRVGHVRARRRGRAPRATRAARRGHREVGRRVPWPGNPRRACTDAPAGMLNSVGLPGPGIDAWIDARPARAARHRARASSRRSGVAPSTTTRAAAPLLADAVARPSSRSRSTSSCPNLHRRAATMFAHDPTTRPREVVGAVVRRRLGCPCSRSSRRTSPTSSTIARAAVDAGATGLTLVNTVMGLVDRRGDPRARCSARAAAGSPARRSNRSRCARCTTSPRAFPASPIIGTGGVQPASTRSR